MLSGPSVLAQEASAFSPLHMLHGFTLPMYFPGTVVPSLPQGLAQMTSFQLRGNSGTLNSELSAGLSSLSKGWSQGVRSKPAVWGSGTVEYCKTLVALSGSQSPPLQTSLSEDCCQ